METGKLVHIKEYVFKRRKMSKFSAPLAIPKCQISG